MATATKKAAAKKAAPKVRITRVYNPPLRPRTIKREVVILTHDDPAELASLVNAELAVSVEPSWRGDGPQSGVEVELCSGIRLSAPRDVFALAIEKHHWEMQKRQPRRRRR